MEQHCRNRGSGNDQASEIRSKKMLFKFINPEIYARYAKAKQAYLEEVARDEKEKALLISNDGNSAKEHAEKNAFLNPYLSVKEAAQLTRLSPSTIRLLIRRGKLQAKHVGRRVIIRREDTRGLVENAQAFKLSA
jgi:excisionase family DNA binding protein